MSMQTWGVDAPAVGSYKEHEVAEVFKPAGFASVLYNLAALRRLASGEALTIPAYQHLDFPVTTELVEEQPIPLSKLTITAKRVVMKEKGRAVLVTGKTQNRSPIDVLAAHKHVVSEMMSRELDEVIATALKTMPIKYVATGVAAQTITTNGTPSGTAAANPNIYHLRFMSNYMSDSLRIPFESRFGGYVGLFRGNGILSVQSDPEFVEIHNGLPEAFRSLQVGRIADMVLMKHNDDRVLRNNIGTGTVSEGLIMGKDAVLFGFIEQIRLIYDFSETKATDFGRFKYIAWLGDYGAGIYSDSANAGLVRGMHWTTA
jgi:hypothetical protein